MRTNILIRIFALFIFALSAINIYAQNVSNDSLDVAKEDNEDKAIDALLEATTRQINEKQKELDSCQKQLVEYKTKVGLLQDTLTILKEKLIQKNKEINSAQKAKDTVEKERDIEKNKNDKLRGSINMMDAIIYKQCLLYPLERRYNEKFIRESITAVEDFSQFSPPRSDKFLEYKGTYMPLLENYKSYNDEIIQFLESVMSTLNLTDGIVGAGHKDKFNLELESLRYYQDCYTVRNDPPSFKSILYLDNVIDKFKKIINKKGDIRQDMTELIKSVKPKK